MILLLSFHCFVVSLVFQRVSFIVAEAPEVGTSAGEGSSQPWLQPKKEEVEDFTFDEPCQKKQKTSSACLGRPKATEISGWQMLRDKLDMNWDFIEVFYDGVPYKLLADTEIKVHPKSPLFTCQPQSQSSVFIDLFTCVDERSNRTRSSDVMLLGYCTIAGFKSSHYFSFVSPVSVFIFILTGTRCLLLELVLLLF